MPYPFRSTGFVLQPLEARWMLSAVSVPHPDHVVVVVEENRSYSEILHTSSAPYIHSLASSGAVFTNAHGVSHPSQPNYLAMFSGTTEHVTDDSTPHSFSSPSLWSTLHRVGKSFVGYSEDLPMAGFTGDSHGAYARKHNPWVNFSNVPVVDNQPLSAFPSDFRKLPTVSYVIPNLNNDMHDGSIRSGDKWLKKYLSTYVAWAQTHNSLLIVTWDEDDGSSDNHTPLLIVGPMVKPGAYGENIDHYNVLRTLEDFYGAKRIGESSLAEPISDVWR